MLCMQVVEFYKAWDRNGALSNFSPHAVDLPAGPVSAAGALPRGAVRAWPSVEHFYQAQKFAGAANTVLCKRRPFLASTLAGTALLPSASAATAEASARQQRAGVRGL